MVKSTGKAGVGEICAFDHLCPRLDDEVKSAGQLNVAAHQSHQAEELIPVTSLATGIGTTCQHVTSNILFTLAKCTVEGSLAVATHSIHELLVPNLLQLCMRIAGQRVLS